MNKLRLLLLIVSLLLLVGCGNNIEPTTTSDTIDRLTAIESRVATLEGEVVTINTKLLSSEDIRLILDPDFTNVTVIEDIGNVTEGCPSSIDVDFWFEQDISESAMDKILDKYNSEECQ